MKHFFSLIFIFSFWCDVFSQKTKLIIPNGMDRVEDLAMDSEKKYFYTLNASKAVMWEYKTGRQLHTFNLSGKKVSGLAVSNDGKKIAIAAESEVYCFSTVSGEMVFKNTKNAELEYSLIFSPDDKWLFVTSEKGLLKLNTNSGILEGKIEKVKTGNSNKLIYLDNFNKLLVPGYKTWDIVDLKTETSTEVSTIEKYKDLPYNAAMPSKGLVFLSQNHQPAIVCDLLTGAVKKVLAENSYDPIFLPSQDDNQFIFCAEGGGYGHKKKTYIYEASSITITKQIKSDISDVKGGYYFGRDNSALLIYSEMLPKFESGPEELVRFSINNEKVIQKYKGTVCSFDGDFFGSINYNHHLGQLDISSNRMSFRRMDVGRMVPLQFAILNQGIDPVAYSQTGDTVAIHDRLANKVIFKNIKTGKVLPISVSTDNTVREGLLFFSNDSQNIYYANTNIRDEKTQLIRFSLKTGQKATVMQMRELDYVYLNFDKTIIGATEYGQSISQSYGLWNVQTGKRILNVPIEDSKNGFIAVSDNKKNAILLKDNKLLYYDIASQSLQSTSKELGAVRNNSFFTVSIERLSASPDLSFVAGTTPFRNDAPGNVILFKRNGELVREFQAHNAKIEKIYFSPDSKYLYTVSADNSIKIWNIENGALIGTLYLFSETNDYVFVSADGRFDGTEGGLKQLSFLKGRDWVSLDKLYEKYYTPNLYQRLLAGEKFAPIPEINIKPKPSSKILYAEKQRNLEVEDDKPTYANITGVAEITVNATAPEDKVDEIRLFHNGKVVILATRGMFVTDNDGSDSKKYSINLLPGTNSFRAVALNSQRTESDADEITVSYGQGGGTPAPWPKPVNGQPPVKIDMVDRNATLHLVIVGINQYQNPKMNLNYAIADATALKDELEKDAKTVLGNVKTYFVTDANATTEGILGAFKQVQSTARTSDVFVFYYAGHGVVSNKNKEFYLVPNNVSNLSNVDAELAEKGIASKLLQQYAIDIPAQKQVFILDACQSAGAFEQMLQQNGDQQKSLALVARSTGTHWLAASGSQQYANEFSQLGHGAFTYVLLNALKGEAAAEKMITVYGLRIFLQNKVPELLKKYGGTPQYPASYGFGNDFPVEVLK